MELTFSGEIWYWRGPAPWFFVTVPDADCAAIQEIAASVTYGWGMIPAEVRIGGSVWETALWPKDGRYIVPVKTAVRRREQVDEGETVTVHLTVAS